MQAQFPGTSVIKRFDELHLFLTLNFGDRRMAHVHVNWLDPHKIRKMTIVGSRRMAVFDDGGDREAQNLRQGHDRQPRLQQLLASP